MNFLIFLKAMAIGFCVAAPVGPCGLLCISRSLRGGFRAGLATGLGVTLADAIYAALGVFGVSATAALLDQWAIPLRIGGAIFLIVLGLKIAFSVPKIEAPDSKTNSTHSEFVSSFLITMANPLTIISFIAIFAGLGTGAPNTFAKSATMVAGVGVGSLSWWLLLSWLSSCFGKRLQPSWIANFTRSAGWIIAALGLFALLTVSATPG